MNYSEVIIRIAHDILSKERPTTLFEQAFFDLRIKMKDLKHDAAMKILKQLEAALKTDLANKKVEVKDLEVKLGRFRGSDFVTSSKMHVVMKSEEDAKRLEKYMQEKFSPKFKFKKLEDGIAEFNIR